MNYWMTVHWPPFEGHDQKYNNIYIPDGREEGLNEIEPGDLVFIYESKTSRSMIRKYKDGVEEKINSTIGREGVIALCEVTTKLYDGGGESTSYSDGTEIWWRWIADTICHNSSGFVNRNEVNRILNYKSNYTLRGFGKNSSGVKKLSHSEFESIRESFISTSIDLSEPILKGNPGRCGGTGEESDAHRILKEAVANDPFKYLGEKDLRLIKIEYPFVTQDKADIVFLSYLGKIVGVEVEVNVGKGDLAGLLQAIKYRRMLELVFKKRIGESRSILVAYSISEEAKKICRKYEIEAHEIAL